TDKGRGECTYGPSTVARERITDLPATNGGIGITSGTCQHWLSVAQALAQALQEVIKSIISEFVKQIILTWVAALAAATVTFGGSTAAAASWTALFSYRAVMQATKTCFTGKHNASMLQGAIKNVTTDLAKAGDVLEKIKTITPMVTATANNQAARSRNNHQNAGDPPPGTDYGDQGYNDISGAIHS